MNTTLTLDKAGRVVIPKLLRDELGLGAGDSLQLESKGDHITLSLVRHASRMRKKNGFWVFHGDGTPLTTAMTSKVLRDIREERDRRNRGEVE